MPDLITLLPMLVILLVIGAATGVIAGLLGVGAASCWCLRSFTPSTPWALADRT